MYSISYDLVVSNELYHRNVIATENEIDDILFTLSSSQYANVIVNEINIDD